MSIGNKLYDKARQAFLDAEINWLTDTVKCILIDVTQYTCVIGTDSVLGDVPAGARVAVSGALTGKTITDGVANAASATFSTVTGAAVGAIVIYQDNGGQKLIAYIDNATGLPVTPNGGDITINWDTGANKIFKL